MNNSELLELTENGIFYDWELAGPDGASYRLKPIRGEHTDDDVTAAKEWLRQGFDVVSVYVAWEKPKQATGKLRTYASRLELLSAENGLIYVGQPHGLSVCDGMDGRTAKSKLEKPVRIDAFTLSMLRQVYNALNEQNREKMDSFSWASAVEIGWKLVSK